MEYKVRVARLGDVKAIYHIGITHKEFVVSKKIRFYKRSELREWITDKKNNQFFVAESENKIIGFLFCKLMSHDWAMIDGFFVLPEYRGRGIGKDMLHLCISKLRSRHIHYATRLIRLSKFTKEYKLIGFKPESKYVWVDEFITHKQ